MKVDVALVECAEAMSRQDIIDLLAALPEDEDLIPLEIEGDISCAMGFITSTAADRIDYRYDQGTELYQFVHDILWDMELESKFPVYSFSKVSDGGTPLKIMLTRELPETIEMLNKPPIGSCRAPNIPPVLIHEMDLCGKYVIASSDGGDMQECKIKQARKDGSTLDGDVEMGFYFKDRWIPLAEVVRF